jgi:hypothetical protein
VCFMTPFHNHIAGDTDIETNTAQLQIQLLRHVEQHNIISVLVLVFGFVVDLEAR